jgi:hypothetical protein
MSPFTEDKKQLEGSCAGFEAHCRGKRREYLLAGEVVYCHIGQIDSSPQRRRPTEFVSLILFQSTIAINVDFLSPSSTLREFLIVLLVGWRQQEVGAGAATLPVPLRFFRSPYSQIERAL